jgi:hypothetical protein
MATKIEATSTSNSVSPPAAMTSLSEKTLDRSAAFKILEGVFPYTEYATACSALASASNNAEKVTLGILFDITAKLSSQDNEHYMGRLVGRLSMESLGTYDDLEDLSAFVIQTHRSNMKKHPDQRKETYHMRSCYCQFHEDEEESD